MHSSCKLERYKSRSGQLLVSADQEISTVRNLTRALRNTTSRLGRYQCNTFDVRLVECCKIIAIRLSWTGESGLRTVQQQYLHWNHDRIIHGYGFHDDHFFVDTYYNDQLPDYGKIYNILNGPKETRYKTSSFQTVVVCRRWGFECLINSEC